MRLGDTRNPENRFLIYQDHPHISEDFPPARSADQRHTSRKLNEFNAVDTVGLKISLWHVSCSLSPVSNDPDIRPVMQQMHSISYEQYMKGV